MPSGARSVLSSKPPAIPPRVFRPKSKRAGAPTTAEKSLVAQFVADQPAEVTPAQVSGLARVLRRSKDAVKKMVEEAKENLQASVDTYREIHLQATMDAAADESMKGKQVAIEASQWAMENIAADGVRVVEKTKSEGPSGPRIIIGVKVGGVDQPVTTVALAPAEDPQ